MDRNARRVIASAVFVVSLLGARAAVAAGVLVPTQHNDNFRTGANLAETQLTPRNLDRLQRVDRYVDGPINTQVLYAPGVMIHGRPHNVAYVTTSANSVYAFDADDRSSAPQGGFLWRRTLTDPQPLARPWRRGINATPVLEFDSGVGTIDVLYSTANHFPWNSAFVDQELALQTTLDVRYYLVKLNLATGNVVKISEPLQGSMPRLGATPISFVAKNESDTASLLLDHGYLYASFSARQNENVSQYYGWMLRYKAADLSYAGAFNSQPFAWAWQSSQDPVYQPPDPKSPLPIACYHPDPSSGRLKPWGSWVKNGGKLTMACVGEGGGIWQGGAGPAADRSGNVYVLIGNGHYEPTQQSYGDSIVKLRSTADAFEPAASFAPPNEQRDDETYDVDLGSAGPLYVDAAKRVVAGGKTGFFYVVDDGLTLKQQVLAGINNRAPDPDGRLRYRTWNEGPHLHGSPTLWTISDRLGYVYEWAEKDYLKKYEFDFTAGTFKVDDPWYPWVKSETEIIAAKCIQLTLCLNAMPGGMLALSANGATPGTGIVWAILTKYDLTSTASIYAFDAGSLKKLWSDPIGAVPHFAGPTVADGHVFVPTNALLSRFSIYSLAANAKPALRAARATRRWQWQTEKAMAPMNSAIPDYAQHPAFRARMTLPAITRQLPPGLIAKAAYAVAGRETYACAAHKPSSCTWKRTEMLLAYSFDDRTERATGSVLSLPEPRAYTSRAAGVPWPLAAEWQLLRKPGGLFGGAPYVLRVRTSFGAAPSDPHSGDNAVPFTAVYIPLVRGR
jgi:hypothetical protein